MSAAAKLATRTTDADTLKWARVGGACPGTIPSRVRGRYLAGRSYAQSDSLAAAQEVFDSLCRVAKFDCEIDAWALGYLSAGGSGLLDPRTAA